MFCFSFYCEFLFLKILTRLHKLSYSLFFIPYSLFLISHFPAHRVYVEPFGLSPDTERLLAGMGYHLDLGDKTWGQAAGILVGGKSLAEIEKGGGARYNGAIDSRAASGEALGY